MKLRKYERIEKGISKLLVLNIDTMLYGPPKYGGSFYCKTKGRSKMHSSLEEARSWRDQTPIVVPEVKAEHKGTILDQITELERQRACIKAKLYELRLKLKGDSEYGKSKEIANAKRREKRSQNIESFREKERLAAKKRRETAWESINLRYREWYARNRDVEAGKQNLRRQTREPYRIIRGAVQLFSEGTITIDECLERVSRAVALSDKINVETAGK